MSTKGSRLPSSPYDIRLMVTEILTDMSRPDYVAPDAAEADQERDVLETDLACTQRDLSKLQLQSVTKEAYDIYQASTGAPQQEPAPVYTAPTPQLTDWTGGYVGLGYSMYSGDLDYSNPGGGSFDLDDSNGANIFGGYLFQSGNIVYGGELAYYDTGDQNVEGVAGASMDNVLDLSGRVGYAIDNVQFYALAGYSMGEFSQGGADEDLDGWNYGLGVEYLVSDQFSVGLQYTGRELEGDNPAVAGQEIDMNHNSVSLRAAFRF